MNGYRVMEARVLPLGISTQKAELIAFQEVIPRYGLPTSIQSDNGPSFLAAATQQVSKFLGINGNCMHHGGPRLWEKPKK